MWFLYQSLGRGASGLTNLLLQMAVAGTRGLVAERLNCVRMVAAAVLLKALISTSQLPQTSDSTCCEERRWKDVGRQETFECRECEYTRN